MKTLLLNKQDAGRLISMKEVIGTVEEAYKAFNSGQVIQPAYTCIHLPPPGRDRLQAGLLPGQRDHLDEGLLRGIPEQPHGARRAQRHGNRSPVRCQNLRAHLRDGWQPHHRPENRRRRSRFGKGAGPQEREDHHLHRHRQSGQDADPRDPGGDDDRNHPRLGPPSPVTGPVQGRHRARVRHPGGDGRVGTRRGGTGRHSRHHDPRQRLAGASRLGSPGTHIVAIGTDTHGKQELEPEVFRNAKIVNDSIAQCVEKGETWHPLDKKIISLADIHAEIGEILLGTKPGRETDDEITIFDSTGMAIQDNTTAHRIYRNAIASNTGTSFEFIPIMTPLLEHPTLRDIHQARERLKPHIRHTPLLRAEKMESALGCQVYLKPETLQITGAFKIEAR
jgi:ornithine cyclodeaminase/alanine dehydrogenase